MIKRIWAKFELPEESQEFKCYMFGNYSISWENGNTIYGYDSNGVPENVGFDEEENPLLFAVENGELSDEPIGRIQFAEDGECAVLIDVNDGRVIGPYERPCDKKLDELIAEIWDTLHPNPKLEITVTKGEKPRMAYVAEIAERGVAVSSHDDFMEDDWG